ncbi:MAG: hypothetical protein HQK51_17185 [Oligoflexia bacterium]|nr:hypothetical protein [Oligoflexia bacterium]
MKILLVLVLVLSFCLILPVLAVTESTAASTATVNKYKENAFNFDHQAITKVACEFWSLSEERTKNIMLGSRMPDIYQRGLSHLFNQQWSHGLLYGKNRTWRWGDANEDFHDNLLGTKGIDQNRNSSPEDETENLFHEGWNNGSADQFYLKDDQTTGDWYLGYASHFIEDVTIPPHTTSPFPGRLDILYHHASFEVWLTNNLEKGHRLIDAAALDNEYYIVTDPSEDLKRAAWNSCYWNEEGYGKEVWDNYVSDGYPTKENSGSPELVKNAKNMITEAVRWSRGTIKWGLDQYNQWTDQQK